MRMTEDPTSGKPGGATTGTVAGNSGAGDSGASVLDAGKNADVTFRTRDAGAEKSAELKVAATKSSVSSASPNMADAAPAQAMVKCPKCGSDVRAIARFCRRCHATMRYTCPSCGHDQRQGGTCEKCGINFMKYIGAVVTVKKAEADMVHERLERRADLLKHILWIPFTGGLSLIKLIFKHAHRD